MTLMIKVKNHQKVKNHCRYTRKYRGAAHSIFNLKCTVPKGRPVVFHKGLNYDYHFVIKKLEKELIVLKKIRKIQNQTFSVPRAKKVRRLIKIEKKS